MYNYNFIKITSASETFFLEREGLYFRVRENKLSLSSISSGGGSSFTPSGASVSLTVRTWDFFVSWPLGCSSFVLPGVCTGGGCGFLLFSVSVSVVSCDK